MSVSSDWQVLVRGEQSAHSPSVPSEPPLVAARQVAKGRVVLAAFDGRYFINDACHPAYGGYTLGKGDGVRFLRQTLDWLAEPSATAGKLFAATPEPPLAAPPTPEAPPPPAPDADCASLRASLAGLPPLRTFRGVIGAHSSLSDGEASPTAMAQAARQMGLDFLVFTETHSRMDDLVATPQCTWHVKLQPGDLRQRSLPTARTPTMPTPADGR